ncbi:MAG: twin-arginine translocase subunit TatC [Bacteroidota bacterium]
MPLDQVDVDQVDLDSAEKEMSFLEHLEELRWHLIRSVIAIAVIAIGVLAAGKPVFEHVILAPKYPQFFTYRLLCGLSDAVCMTPPKLELITRELGEQFMVHLKVSFVLGLMVAFPYIFYEIWRFIRPGLLPKERRAARGVVVICSLLFMMGVLFGYYVISPFAINFLGNYDMGATNAPTLSSFVNYMTMFTLPTGILFQLPVAVFILTKVGLLSVQFMRTYRRHAFVLILILSAFLTPPDVITQILIGCPLYFLYEGSILIAKRVERRREAELR